VITLELGRSGRTLLTSAAAGDASYGVIDNGPADTAWAEGLYAVLSLRHFGLADAALYPLARRRRAPIGTRLVSRQTRSRRLPADVADCSFWCNSGSGRTLELGDRAARC
jgi:hypothetical protein